MSVKQLIANLAGENIRCQVPRIATQIASRQGGSENAKRMVEYSAAAFRDAGTNANPATYPYQRLRSGVRPRPSAPVVHRQGKAQGA
jgi:hypothetical protein